MKKIFAVILSLVLIFSMTACVASKPEEPSSPAATQPAATTHANENPATTPAPGGEETEPTIPEATTVEFEFIVVDPDGNEENFTIATEKTTVGEALIENGLIEGEQGPYGLYVKTVNGITLDYDTDGMYWSFYVNGEYGMTGVDMTDIVPGTVYMFKAEAA